MDDTMTRCLASTAWASRANPCRPNGVDQFRPDEIIDERSAKIRGRMEDDIDLSPRSASDPIASGPGKSRRHAAPRI